MMRASDIIVGFDPSSTVVGYAAISPAGRLVEAGLIEPEDKISGSFVRDMQLCDDVEAVLERMQPAVVLIEWTKGKVGKRHKGRGAGLAVYGTGVGSVGRQCWLWARDRRDVTVEAVLENTWSRRIDKTTRAMATEQFYPELSTVSDPGFDIHDAVGLCRWWIQERKLKI